MSEQIIILYDKSTKDIANAILRYLKYVKNTNTENIKKWGIKELLKKNDYNGYTFYYITQNSVPHFIINRKNYELLNLIKDKTVYILDIQNNDLFKELEFKNINWEECKNEKFNLAH